MAILPLGGAFGSSLNILCDINHVQRCLKDMVLFFGKGSYSTLCKTIGSISVICTCGHDPCINVLVFMAKAIFCFL